MHVARAKKYLLSFWRNFTTFNTKIKIALFVVIIRQLMSCCVPNGKNELVYFLDPDRSRERDL